MATALTFTIDHHEQLKDHIAFFRSDLHVSRQIYEREPVYVVHDPVSFQTHRLDASQYTLAASLRGNQTLREVFEGLVRKGKLNEREESHFYELITNLYKAGMVILPIHRGDRFYQQSENIRALKRQKFWISLLFLRIPISNPDLFLSRTLPHVAWLFSRWFTMIWLVTGLLALLVLAARFGEFTAPLTGMLSPKNLPMLWAVFVGLKLWHELGHGYACKRFGGRVPEMGTILIVGNPLAYVDATAAWSFPERWKRLVVMCGGMYFESLVAIPALFVWSLAGHGVVASCAHQVVITASVVTLLFNANPLMKFDGYFILSELLRLPNLRARADAQVKRALKQTFLGISSGPTETPRTRIVLLTYGVASAIYRAFLVLTIAILVAHRFPLVGIAIAVCYAGSSLGATATKVGQYLLNHKETSPVRFRARSVAVLCFGGLPLAAFLLPVPFDVVAWGVVGAEKEHIVRVETPGEFQMSEICPGQIVEAGETLVQLTNLNVEAEFEVAEVLLQEAILKWKIAREQDLVESARIQAEIGELDQRVSEAHRNVQALSIVAPDRGRVARVDAQSNGGEYFKAGQAVAMLVDGRPILRVWLTQDQLNSIVQDTADARFRIPGCSEKTFQGRIASIKPAAEMVITEQALTVLGGGDLMVDPQTNRPLEAMFQVEIEPDEEVLPLNKHGCRVAVALPRTYESISSWTFRKCWRLLQQLLHA